MMRTKHLLVSAMALPLLFAACSQEELVSDNSNSPALAARKTVQNVVINLNEPETRMAFEGTGYTWKAGDQFGACLMDEFLEATAPGSTWWDNFTLKDYIQTNYPFTRQENGNWTSEAVMQEGNYFFYFPYNYNLGGKRTPIRLAMPTEQYVADDEATTAVLSDQLFVGYQPIVAEEGKESESLSLTLEPLLAFPAFHLTNVGTGSLTIQKVAFADDDTEWPTELLVKPAAGSFDNDGFADMTAAEQRAALKSIVDEGDETVARITVTLGENGRKLSSQEDMWVYIMVPEKSGLTAPKLYIYTDKGLGVADLSAPHKDAGAGTTVNITNDRALKDIVYNDGAYVDITFDNTSFGQPSDMPVSTTSDLENLVSWSKNSTQATLTATVSGDKVEISKAVYDMLNANDKLVLNIVCDNNGDATVTIPADAPANALDRVSFKNVNIVNKADVTLSTDLTRTVGAPAKVTNEKVITFSGNSYDLSTTMVDNNGTVTFKAANGKDMSVKMDNQKYLNNTNKGTVAIATNVAVTAGGIVNNGTLTINEGAALEGRIVNGAEDSKDGVINVNGAWTTKFQTGANYGVINVAATGKLTVPSGSTYTNNANAVPNEKGEVVFESVINNSGVINGVTNDGTIKMVVKSARLTTATGSTGDINNTVAAENLTAGGADEEVYCEVAETIEVKDLQALVETTKANRLDISGEIKMTTKTGNTEDTELSVEVAAVNVVGDLTINAPGKIIRFVNSAEGTNLTIAEGNTTLTATTKLVLGTSSANPTGTLNIGEDGFLLVSNNAEIYAKKGTGVDGNYESHGVFGVK